jgi:small subunit ribosomal protein S26e
MRDLYIDREVQTKLNITNHYNNFCHLKIRMELAWPITKCDRGLFLQHDLHNKGNVMYFEILNILFLHRIGKKSLTLDLILNTRFKGCLWALIYVMPKKRTSRGRTKGGKGSSGTVHCSKCGAMVPRDKAKKVTGRITLVEPTLAKELRAAGAYIAAPTDIKFYCVSCAVHMGVVKVRSEFDRRTAGRPR